MLGYLHDFSCGSSFPEDCCFSIPMAFPFVCCFYKNIVKENGVCQPCLSCLSLKGYDGLQGAFVCFGGLLVGFLTRLGASRREKSCPPGGSGKLSSSMGV